MPVTVTFEPLQDGTYRMVSSGSDFMILQSLGHVAMVARSLAEEAEALGIHGDIQVVFKSSALANANEEDDNDDGFEADLDYLLTKNAELYRRLAL